jgi:hypothetical protein
MAPEWGIHQETRKPTMSLKDKPHFTLPAAALAGWIESQRKIGGRWMETLV